MAMTAYNGVTVPAFMYGTATFEGIRAYWNEEQEQLYLLKALPHFKRMANSAKVLLAFLSAWKP